MPGCASRRAAGMDPMVVARGLLGYRPAAEAVPNVWAEELDVSATGFPRGSTVAFSGGGSRSFANAIGTLRALEELGLAREVEAVSAVSGGAWASSI